MRTPVPPFVAILCSAFLSLLAGCGTNHPTAPLAARPDSLDVTVTLDRIFAVADGDGIEGAGDFDYSATVFASAGKAMGAEGSAKIETGSSLALNRSRVYRFEKGSDGIVEVSFTATEWDQNIFGEVYPDSRLDHVTEFRIHSETKAGATFNDGERWITLGSGGLQLRLIYRITSKAVV